MLHSGVRGTYLSECIVGHSEVRDAQTGIIFYSFRRPFPQCPHIPLLILSFYFPPSLSLLPFLFLHFFFFYITKNRKFYGRTRPVAPCTYIREICQSSLQTLHRKDFIFSSVLFFLFFPFCETTVALILSNIL